MENGTVLRALLIESRQQSHTDFSDVYQVLAERLGTRSHPPTKTQYYRWLSGEIQGLPRGPHCRVLEAMFPDRTVEELFAPAAEEATNGVAASVTNGVSSVAGGPTLAEFLGAEMATDGATLVYPTFELAPEVQALAGKAGISRQHTFAKPDSAFTAHHRIDVPMALAENDVRALLYVSSLLQRFTTLRSDIDSDQNVVRRCDRPFISFGLSSNDCTHMYLDQTREPLFAIREDPKSVDFMELIELADGSVHRSTQDVHVGIIARVRPDPILHPDRYWFFCSGLGPRGTTGAAWFLAHHWDRLHEMARAAEFVAVVSVRVFSDEATRLDHLYLADEDAKQ